MRRFLAWLLIGALLLGCAGCAERTEEGGGTRLIALNMGKADCLLLLCEGRAWLIDSGYAYTYNLLAEALRRCGVERLDGVFLTHCDKDHYGGLNALAESAVAVDAWYAPALYYGVRAEMHPLVTAAARRGDNVTWLSAGDELPLGETGRLRVIGPLTLNTENENNNSLVFYAETADGTLLFTGDMKLNEEYELLNAGLIEAADVLKVPFHGDNSASSESFVERVAPGLALICTSTAEEPDTPASSVLKRYKRSGAEIVVTQDYARGVEITLQGGKARAQALQWDDLPDYSRWVRASITLSDDLLTLRNSSDQPIDLSGWIVYSTRGEDSFRLPQGAALPANGVYKIGSRATSSAVDCSLDVKRIWHKSKLDRAVILDGTGGVAAVTDNGMPE